MHLHNDVHITARCDSSMTQALLTLECSAKKMRLLNANKNKYMTTDTNYNKDLEYIIIATPAKVSILLDIRVQ